MDCAVLLITVYLKFGGVFILFLNIHSSTVWLEKKKVSNCKKSPRTPRLKISYWVVEGGSWGSLGMALWSRLDKEPFSEALQGNAKIIVWLWIQTLLLTSLPDCPFHFHGSAPRLFSNANVHENWAMHRKHQLRSAQRLAGNSLKPLWKGPVLKC